MVVIGLPRGGVPVAAEVARELRAPLDVIVVRKLGVPVQPELAMGAIGEGGARVVNHDVVRAAHVTAREFAAVEAEQRDELTRRAMRFRGERPRIAARGQGRDRRGRRDRDRVDGESRVRRGEIQGASRVVLAVPVAPPDWTTRLAGVADELVCVATPEPFFAVGQFYDDFAQTTDDEVVGCLRNARAAPQSTPDRPGRIDRDRSLGGHQPDRRSRRARRCPRGRALRARERQQSPQPAQPLRQRRA